MFLEKIIIINYQSCKSVELHLSKDDPTVLIGINDCGKSSILKAIDLLFDGKTQYYFQKEDKIRKDLSNTTVKEEDFKNIFDRQNLPYPDYNGNQSLIIGKLIIEKDDLFESFEDSISNQLLWCLENSIDDTIWLMKLFDSESNEMKEFLLLQDGSDTPLNLWSSKATDLKQYKKEYNVTDEEVENENRSGRFKNIELIRAIYKKTNLENIWSEYKEKEKKKDKVLFPEISYLDWNFTFDDLLNFTNTIMNQSISPTLDEVRDFANEKAKKAQEIVNNDLQEIAAFLSDEVTTVDQIKSNVFINVQSKITDLVLNKNNTDQDIHLESQGDGVKRQIWFAMVKWKAKKTLENKNKNKKLIWCFDEPETHLYPAAQRDFFAKIKTITKGNVQSMISTHSTIFVDRANLSEINKIALMDGYSEHSKCKTVNEIFESLNLKNSDFLFFDRFLIIEGETEKYLIPYLYTIFTKRKLENDNVQLITLSGKDKWTERKKALESIFADFKKSSDSIVYLFDADMKYEIGQKAVTDNMFFIGRQDIEDTIDYNIWNNLVKEITSNEIDFTKKEYDEIIEQIPNNKKIGRQEKFLAKLETLVKIKLTNKRDEVIGWDILPPKGQALAEAINRNITSHDLIDNKIIEAFKKISEF